MNLKFLVVTIVLLIASGCAKDAYKIAPDYVSPLEYQNYTCVQLGAELSAMVRWAQDQEEAKLRLLTNEIEVITQAAKEKNCQALIQLFEESQEEAKKEIERRITAHTALTVLGCLRTLKLYRQPQLFVTALLGCTIFVGITN